MLNKWCLNIGMKKVNKRSSKWDQVNEQKKKPFRQQLYQHVRTTFIDITVTKLKKTDTTRNSHMGKHNQG